MFPVAALARRVMTGEPGDLERGLVRRLAAGDAAAVEQLYARYGRPLWSYVFDLVADAQLAEEIVQDTFVVAWRHARDFEGRSTLASWLFGIARRQARDRTRRRVLALEPVEALETVPADVRGPEAEAIAAASREEVRTALDRLPERHREVLMLAFAYEMSGTEIAGVLGVPEGTVKSRLFAARRALRAELEPRMDR